MIFSAPDFDDHERVLFVRDRDSGLRAIIAIHNTALGPSLGGCRMYPYATEEAALRDVLRLSRGMSYKAAMAGVDLGGGKSVIIGDPRRDKTEALLRALGRAIRDLNGTYIVGEDIGTNPADMQVIKQETAAVSCLSREDGGYGDPAPMTALGVMQAMRAALNARFGDPSLDDAKVAVQGVGNVGFNLCRLLTEAGARLVVCDTYRPFADRAAEAFGADVVEPDQIYLADAGIFAPCAIGGTLNSETIPLLAARIVAGAANNQLAGQEDMQRLADRDITYVPDYVANGGGLISCAAEWYRTDAAEIESRVMGIYDTSLMILNLARTSAITTGDAADRIAEERLAAPAPRPSVACSSA